MPSCNITKTYQVKNVQAALSQAKALGAAESPPVKFTGDATKGAFTNGETGSSAVAGTYSVNGQSVTVNVTQKPSVWGIPVPDSAVVSKLDKFFAGK